jgi:MerR family redox-sensitive transcriptional activator SoxR
VLGLSIGEVARRAGLRPSAIRYYEKLGLIPRPPRTSGRRQYDERVLERLAMVRFAKHVGFSIRETKVLFDGVEGRPPTERWKRLAREKARQVDTFIANAGLVLKMLQETLEHRCPMLVDRGRALQSHPAPPRLRRNRR